MNHTTRILRGILVALTLGVLAAAPARADGVKPIEIKAMGQVILKVPLAAGVSMDDAAESLKQRANSLNFKLVGELPLSEQVASMTGQPQRRMTIYQFCDAPTAMKMVNANMVFASFLPCRIALIEDKDGKAYLVTLSLDGMIDAAKLSPELKPLAVEVRDKIMNILMAGANGDL